MKLLVITTALALWAYPAMCEEQSHTSCRGDPQAVLPELQQFLPAGTTPSKGKAFVRTYDLKVMQKNLPEEGVVSTEAMAVDLGQIILAKIYGEKIIENEKPFEASQIKRGVWLVKRKITDEMVQNCIVPTVGHYVAIRQRDAAVLGVRQDK